jgi:hypothetical protein
MNKTKQQVAMPIKLLISYQDAHAGTTVKESTTEYFRT